MIPNQLKNNFVSVQERSRAVVKKEISPKISGPAAATNIS